jgi:hypothetical protein
MSMDLQLPPVHRPEFFPGELLHAAELGDLVAVERSLRWLHNRALHGWGLALSLEVTGPRGATEVTVAPGYAIDAAGRDLVLEQPVTVPVPPVAAGADGKAVTFLLVLAYTDDEDATVELREGACETAGAVRRSDTPVVAWRRPQAVREGIDLLLASASVLNCALADDLVTTGARRSLGVVPSPYVVGGSSQSGWRAWPDDTSPAGLTTTVDTSAAGFGDTPVYQARVEGFREVIPGDSVTGSSFVLDGHPHVARAGLLSFDLVVPLPVGELPLAGGGTVAVNPAAAVADAGLPALVENTLNWHVVWIGVEAT